MPSTASRRSTPSRWLYSCSSVPLSSGNAEQTRASQGVTCAVSAQLPQQVVVTSASVSSSDVCHALERRPAAHTDNTNENPFLHDGVDGEVEEVHSCMTLSSTHSSQMATPVSHPQSQGNKKSDRDAEEEDEEGHPLLHSGASCAPSLQATQVHVARLGLAASKAGSADVNGHHVDTSPSPVSPMPKAGIGAAHAQCVSHAPQHSYRVLDSEPSAPARPLSSEATVDVSLTPLASATTTAATATPDPPQTCVEASVGALPSAANSAPTPRTTAAATSNEDVLSDEQRYAYHLAVREHRSIFITGGAGTGKSHLLRIIIRGLPLSSTFVTATTGIAALNLSGTTLHSFVGCGVPDKQASPSKILGIVMSKARVIRNWRVCRVLIIDEVSMLEASFFDLVDFIARRVRNRPDEPFGGIQLILSGDFLQLPPVTKERRCNTASFCFETATWINVNPKICLLSTPFRQRDLRFFEILNEMRFGDLQAESIALLHSIDTTNRVHFVRRSAVKDEDETEERKVVVSLKRGREPAHEGDPAPTDGKDDAVDDDTIPRSVFYDPPSREGERQTRLQLVDGTGKPINAPFDGYTILRPTRVEVEAQNKRYFSQLDTEVFTYVGSHSGAGTFPSNNLSKEVRLRKGCRVMVIKNFDSSTKLVNGSTGTVTGFISFARGYRFQSPGIALSDAHSICIGRGRDDKKAHTMLPVVAFDSRNPPGSSTVDEIVVEPQEWKETEGEKVKSRAVQLPLVLAYAITIHKSQGMSLSQVDIDFAQVFEAGQSYVALSRCTDLQRVRLHGFNVTFVSANTKALAYYKALSLQQQRLEWQRQHTPHVVAAMEDVEARSCTPYGYLLSNDVDVLRRYGEEDSSPGPCHASGEDEADGEDEDAKEENGPSAGRSRTRSSLRHIDLGHPSETADLADANGRWVSETLRLDDLRRRITPVLHMADLVKRLALREMLPLPKVRNTRLVMDINALFHLVTGPESAVAFDVLFGEQDNMMRVPLCVQHLIEEAAAYRTTSQSLTPSTTQEQPPTSSQQRQQHQLLRDTVASAEDLRPDAALLSASDVAAEALAVMERAKNDFILDVQRVEQTAALPEPMMHWLRFADVLPLLRRPSVEEAEEAAGRSSQQSGGDAANSELNFILNRDPREVTQHRAIVEYALFLKASFGQNVAVCTDSITLAAYALAWDLRVVSVENLF